MAQKINIFELVGIFLKKLKVIPPSQDAQIVCAVAKRGAVLNRLFQLGLLIDIRSVQYMELNYSMNRSMILESTDSVPGNYPKAIN